MRHLAIPAMLLALMGTGPALAGSQSSNSSSNCSNGHCSVFESFTTDDGRFSRGYYRRDAWHEGRGHWRDERRYARRDRDHWERRYRGDRRGRDDDDD